MTGNNRDDDITVPNIFAGDPSGPAGPAGRCDLPSAGIHVDGHGHAVSDDVEHGGPLAGLLHDRAQLVRVVARNVKPTLICW